MKCRCRTYEFICGETLVLKKVSGPILENRMMKYISKKIYTNINQFFHYLYSKAYLIDNIDFKEDRIFLTSEGQDYVILLNKVDINREEFTKEKEIFLKKYNSIDKKEQQNKEKMLQQQTLDLLYEFLETGLIKKLENATELSEYLYWNSDEMVDVMNCQNNIKFMIPNSKKTFWFGFSLIFINALVFGCVCFTDVKDISNYLREFGLFVSCVSTGFIGMYFSQKNDKRHCRNIFNTFDSTFNSNISLKEYDFVDSFNEKDNNFEQCDTLYEIIAEDLSVLDLTKEENKKIIDSFCKLSLNRLDDMTLEERYKVVNELIMLELEMYSSCPINNMFLNSDVLDLRINLLIGKDRRLIEEIPNNIEEILSKISELIKLAQNSKGLNINILKFIKLAQDYVFNVYSKDFSYTDRINSCINDVTKLDDYNIISYEKKYIMEKNNENYKKMP